MQAKAFLNALANGREDMVQVLLDILAQTRSAYCVIGGLAVNAYAEPVVSLDLDLVVAVADLPGVCQAAQARGLRVEHFEPSVNLSSPLSDLRVQIQTDARYQEFISRSRPRDVLGYAMQVAAPEDVLQGKIWAWRDARRRASKRQKDLADILRLVEANPHLAPRVPAEILDRLR